MAPLSLTALALTLAYTLASPVHHMPAANVAAPTPAPTLIRRQDDASYSYPASGCVYTSFSEAIITMTEYVGSTFSASVSENIVTAAPGCLCEGGVIAGLWTDTAQTEGTQNVYCATGTGDDGTPTGSPVTSVTNAICMASKNADTWSSFDMPAWVSSQATELAPFSTGFAAAIQDQLTGLSARGYSCEWSYGGTQYDPGEAADVCPENPQAAYATMAVANLVNYLDDVFQTLQVVINTMTPMFATFPETFNPNNITVLPGSSAAGISSTSLYFVGSLAALIPGLGAVSGASAKALGGLGAVSYMGGSAAGVANIGTDSGNIEVQFASFAAISELLGELSQATSDDFSTFASSRLDEIPPDGFETDPQQLPSILASRAFAEPHEPFSLSMAQNLTAAVAGPGINLLWQYSGVVIAKVNSNNLPIDPCDGDTLFTSDVKYCDADGNMFIIQAKPEDDFGGSITENSLDDPAKYAVPGFDDIARYNLTVYDIVTSSWNNQVEYGPASEGPDAQDFINGLIEKQPEWLPRDEYIFFNLNVCDFDAIDMDDDNISSLGESNCGDKTAENATCWFYFLLAGACPLNADFDPGDGSESTWPWGYAWIVAGTDDCGLVDTDGDPACT